MSDSARQAVAVVGAGIVGTSIAHELARRGHRVTLVDRDAPGSGCSFGNSGAISAGSVVPLAMPGVLASLPAMLGDPTRPLYLPWRYLPRALPWLARFVAAARPRRVAQSVAKLATLHDDAVALHRALSREVGVAELFVARGHLHLYPDANALARDEVAWRLRAEHGHRAERLSRADILALEPHAPARYTVAMFLADHATIVNPWRYVQAIAAAFVARGGRIERANVQALGRDGDGWRLEGLSQARFSDVVVAAGAWSNRLLAPLGARLPLTSQRGYHVQFRGAAPVTRTVVLADHKVFLTPMEQGLRAGGTVEIGGLAAPPDARRSAMLARLAQQAFPDLRLEGSSTWMGHRPCTPDSVPVIGPVAQQPGLHVATGHGHLGLTDAPRTALFVADALAARHGARV